MNRAIAWFATNHVAANLLMLLLIAGGLLTLPRIRQEVFPELTLPVITVSVDYPGASPAEVEDAICVRIEEVLQGLQGIKRIHATANEGNGSVSVELLAGEDAGVRRDEIRSRVDRIETFPDEAKRPVVRQADLRFQVLHVAVSGNVDELTLKRLGEQARDEIASLPGITDVDLVATHPYEMSIEVSEDGRHLLLKLDEVRAGSLLLSDDILQRVFGRLLEDARHSSLRDRSPDAWSQAFRDVDHVSKLFDGVLIRNRFVWPNGHRRFRIESIYVRDGAITAVIDPL